jgi:DNA repair exonuclease SbcCD ATPase subunit
LKDVGIRVLTIKTICHGNTKKKGSFLITDHHLADRQIFLLQNYFLENPVDTDSESIKDVLQFHKVLLENSAESVPEGTQPFRNFNVRLLRFKNVFSFTENAEPYSDGFHQIDFTKFEKGSVVGLLGSNFVGKSSIFDIILYALYEKCSRGKKSDVLSKGCRSFEIQLRFQVSGIPYEIWRRGVSSTSLGRASGDKMTYGSRFRERHEFDQPLSWNGTDKKSNIIKKILCDYDEFIFSTFMLQNTPDNFLSDTAGERYKFFSKLLGFDHFDKQVALAKKMSLENTGAISQLERIIASSLKTLDGHVARIAQMSCAVSSITVQEKIAALLKQKQKVMTDNSILLNGRHSFVSVDQDFESFSSRFCDFKRDSLSFLQTLGLTLDALDQSHVSMTEHERHIEYCLDKVHKLRESKHQLSLDLCVLSQSVDESELYSLEMEGETLEADITDCIALLSEYESDKRKFECLSVEYMAIWSQITTWGQQEYPMKKRQRLSKDPETVSDYEKSDLFDPNCRYCRKNFDLDKRDELLQRLNFLETELRPLSQPLSAGNKLDFVFCHKAEYNALTERLSALEKQKAVVKQQIGDIRSVVENRQRISWNKKVDQVILDVEEEIRQLEVDGEKGRHPHLQIALLKETYKSMKDEETMFHVISSLERYDKEITQLENLAEAGQSLESLILQETVKRDQMQQLVKTYENEINELHKKARVISFYIEMFEVKLPNMLLLQSLPKIQEILNDMCSKIDLPFQYYIVADSLQGLYMTLNGLSFAMCSGFEQLVTSIFFRVALKIVGLSKSDVIFLDETFNCLDATHKRLLKPIFDLLCEHYDNVIIVSHDPDVKNFVQHSISVEKNRLTAPQ